MMPKINILRSRPEATEEEVRRYMNFDKVLKQYHVRHAKVGNWQRGLYLSAGSVIVAAGIYLLLPTRPASPEPPRQDAIMAMPDSSSVKEGVAEAPSTAASREEAMKDAVQVKKETLQTEGDEKLQEADESAAPTFDYVEAEPVNGYPHLYSYFDSELHYPKDAIGDTIQGTLSVSFVIDRDGKPVKIQIENSLGPLFDQETVRLIQNMPAWKPATVNGKSLPSRISLPLTFRLLKLPLEKPK